MNLKVVILDDEYIIRDGLCSFPWNDYGCQVAGSAEDGLEGLELVEKHRPDIILSDIKMPEMDGLTLSARVKERFPETEIILLTGYDDFEFAQQALRIGVAEYLLKPVDFREMHSVVEKVCKRILEREKKKTDYIVLREKYRKAMPHMVDKAISDMVFGRLKDKKDMREMIRRLNLRLDSYLAVYGRIINGGEEAEVKLEPGLFEFAVCNICEEIFREEKAGIHVYSVTDTMGYCFIISYPEFLADMDCMNHCIAACERAQDEIKKIVQSCISFGVSNVSRDICRLNEVYTEALDACEESSFVDDTGTIMQYSDINSVKLNVWDITEGEKKRIISEIARGNTETAMKLLVRVFEKCNEMDAMRYAAADLLLHCSRYVCSDNHFLDTGQKQENNKVFLESAERIFLCRNQKDLMNSLKKALQRIGNQNKDVHLNRNQRLGEEIEAYILENYGEDLSLDSLADHFKISKTYVNRLLKKHTGKSFLENLVDIRMIKAKQLISENEYKVYEVAEMVGYRDLSYFIRVFKKTYGVTPNNYKKN